MVDDWRQCGRCHCRHFVRPAGGAVGRAPMERYHANWIFCYVGHEALAYIVAFICAEAVVGLHPKYDGSPGP